MIEKKYTLGVDFGTLSARALLMSVEDGREIAEATAFYPHAVMDSELPNGRRLPPQFALQHPRDYLLALQEAVGEALGSASVLPSEICGVGIDFTACTLLSVDADGEPLCFKDAFLDEPLAYALLWKHHGAQRYADLMNRVAEERKEKWLGFIGGRVSSESMFPKILQILHEAPAVYEAADRFTEAGDWIVRVLTGGEHHSRNIAGYKAFFTRDGYPSQEYLSAVDPALDGLIGTKVSPCVRALTEVPLSISKEGAALSGLAEGTPIALSMIDAQAAIPALNVTEEGELLAVMGTSACYIIHSPQTRDVSCVFGAAEDAIFQGLCTYEAGQAGLGDSFDWFCKSCVPKEYFKEAAERGMGIHAFLREKAMRLEVGESGLLVMDWFNGDRSLKNDDLSSMILGITVQTKPEELYRALIEATAYGARRIAESFEDCGIPVRRICATGGIARKDPMMMQILSDVTGREVRVGGTGQAGARGSAILGSVAGGRFKDLREASGFFALPDHAIYKPNADAKGRYDALYREYRLLYDHFGKEDGVLCRLSKMRRGMLRT